MKTKSFAMVWASVAAFAAAALFTSTAHAQCTKDTDCKGDRVCEAGLCQAPGPAVAPPAPAEAAPAEAAPEPEPEPVAAPPPPARRRAREAKPAEASEPVDAPKPQRKMERHSTGMMAAGIVMVSISPIPLFAGVLYSVAGATCRGSDPDLDGTNTRDCSHYNTASIVYTTSALALIGVGVPLIVIGAKRVPAREPEVAVLPYAAPDGAGLRLRLQL